MTTPYIDPKIIFASDAPTQDKPAAFANYDKGMDETRKNEGRPTIKQFNYLQQQNDLKFLYIHERGACLPFVAGFPYENNAIVFKDDSIQQKNGSSWVIPFMRGSQNLAELTNVAQARTKLGVYSKSDALAKDNNLSELTDKVAARTNLGVYSKAETDAIAGTPNATEAIAGKAKIATTAIAQAGVNDTDFITPLKLKNSAFGLGQTWQDVKSSRNVNTIYTNTTGKPIIVNICWNYLGGGNNYAKFLVNGISVARGYQEPDDGVSVVIPPGSNYQYSASGWGITNWMEYR